MIELTDMKILTDDAYLSQVFAYYQQTLASDTHRQAWLYQLGVTSKICRLHHIGLCDRSLGKQLDPDDLQFRGCMQRLGLFKPTGHELFRGCIVVPAYNPHGLIVAAYGVRYAKYLGPGRPRHLVWYRGGAYTEEIAFPEPVEVLSHVN